MKKQAGSVRRAKKTTSSPQFQLITPFLWFDKEAEQAAKFYCSVFPKSKITQITRYGEAGPGPLGSVMTVEFVLNGQQFVALNAGPTYKFTEAISFVVNVRTQKELDYYWSKLSARGEEVACGWLKDKYGLSWQITPIVMMEMLAGRDANKTNRAMKAMMEMVKLDIKKLQAAYNGK